MYKKKIFIHTTYTPKRSCNNLMMKILDRLHDLAKLHSKRRGERRSKHPIE
jgi:hypothetical protein